MHTLADISGLPELTPVDKVWFSGWYDGPITGVARYAGREYWFVMVVAPEGGASWDFDPRRYALHRLSDEQLAEAWRMHRAFAAAGFPGCLHAPPCAVDETRSLIAAQCPAWAGRPLSPAGAGTENVMYRLGDDLLVRLPRTVDKAAALHKELRWLPRLGALLATSVPEPVHAGTPTPAYPVAWSVFRWLDGAEPGTATVGDWATFGTDLATFVRELHATDLMGATRAGDLAGYRGGSLQDCDGWVTRAIADCPDPDLDVDTLGRWWREALTLPEPTGPHVWLHTDLKPTNLLVRAGRLTAVIDFGGLTVGLPDAEHATVWDLPAPAREAYRRELGVDGPTWIRARAWALAVALSGLPYYWHTYPAFVQECRRRLHAILQDPIPSS